MGKHKDPNKRKRNEQHSAPPPPLPPQSLATKSTSSLHTSAPRASQPRSSPRASQPRSSPRISQPRYAPRTYQPSYGPHPSKPRSNFHTYPPPSAPRTSQHASTPLDTLSQASHMSTSTHPQSLHLSREQSAAQTTESVPTNGSAPTTESGTSIKRIPFYLRGKFLEPSDTCSRLIRGIIEEKIDFEGYNWKAVSKETKEFYFGEFRKHCIWDETIDYWIKKSWKTKASLRYRDMVSDAKASKKKPKFINQETWKRWQRYWNTPDAKRISKKYSDNRMTYASDGKGPSTHTGGSITHHKYGERLARELGRKTTAPELHLYTHTKNHDGKTFTNNKKSKKIHDTFTSKLEQLKQDNEIVDENRLYLDVVGGVNRNGVYGLRYETCEYYGTSMPVASFQFRQQNNEEINELRQRIVQQDVVIEDLKALTKHLLQRMDGMDGISRTQLPRQQDGDDEDSSGADDEESSGDEESDDHDEESAAT